VVDRDRRIWDYSGDSAPVREEYRGGRGLIVAALSVGVLLVIRCVWEDIAAEEMINIYVLGNTRERKSVELTPEPDREWYID